MDNNHKGKIEEVIYHGDHTRLRVDLLGNNQFILKVPTVLIEWILKRVEKLILVGIVLIVEL
jgi:putative spermidine/putrescine transport system ATP-binding protein